PVVNVPELKKLHAFTFTPDLAISPATFVLYGKSLFTKPVKFPVNKETFMVTKNFVDCTGMVNDDPDIDTRPPPLPWLLAIIITPFVASNLKIPARSLGVIGCFVQ